MSGVAMMRDDTKHIYHSIAMETPGMVTVPEGSRCCSGGRKVMTLLLASALLWVIVLDIMLVAYRSRHLGDSTSDTPSESLLAGRVVILGAALASPGNLSFSTPPPVTLLSPNASDAAVRRRDAAAGESGGESGGESTDRPAAKMGRIAGPLPGLEGWLSRLRHRPQSALLTSLDRPPWRRPALAGFPPFWVSASHRQNGAELRPAVSADHHMTSQPPPIAGPAPGQEQVFVSPFERRSRPGPPLADGAKPLPEAVVHAAKPLQETGLHAARPLPEAGLHAARPLPEAGLHAAKPLPETGLHAARPLPEAELHAARAPPKEAGLLLRFFSAVVDAPWNFTSRAEERHFAPPPPPLPPPRQLLPERFMHAPSPRFMRAPEHLNVDPVIHFNDDEDDSEDTIFDIDLTK